MVCTSLAVVVPWFLSWLTERVELVELAQLATKLAVIIIAVPRSLSTVVEVESVAPRSLSVARCIMYSPMLASQVAVVEVYLICLESVSRELVAVEVGFDCTLV